MGASYIQMKSEVDKNVRKKFTNGYAYPESIIKKIEQYKEEVRIATRTSTIRINSKGLDKR